MEMDRPSPKAHFSSRASTEKLYYVTGPTEEIARVDAPSLLRLSLVDLGERLKALFPWSPVPILSATAQLTSRLPNNHDARGIYLLPHSTIRNVRDNPVDIREYAEFLKSHPDLHHMRSDGQEYTAIDLLSDAEGYAEFLVANRDNPKPFSEFRPGHALRARDLSPEFLRETRAGVVIDDDGEFVCVNQVDKTRT